MAQQAEHEWSTAGGTAMEAKKQSSRTGARGRYESLEMSMVAAVVEEGGGGMFARKK